MLGHSSSTAAGAIREKNRRIEFEIIRSEDYLATCVILRVSVLAAPSHALKQVRTLQIGGVLLGRSPLV
jgi:hypothetical protein